MKRVLLALALSGFANLHALACVEVTEREVPLSPPRVAHFEKERDQARSDADTARKQKDEVGVRIAQSRLARIERTLAKGSETVDERAPPRPVAAKPPAAGGKKDEQVAAAASRKCSG